MAIIEVPDSGATAPNDITEKDGVTANVPVDLTEKAATTPDAPNTLTETADTGASTPNDITEKASNNATAPNDLTEKAAASASLPNDLTEVADTGAAIPVNLTEVSSSDALAPNDLTEKAAVTPDAPNDLTETVSSGAAAPSTITSVDACPFPRTLTPLLNLDFANQSYAQGQTSVAFDDLFTYSRNSNATFWNRRLDRNGKWKTFLDTDIAGDVTNRLVGSEDLSYWDGVGVSYIANAATNPLDGKLTASKLYETSGMTHQMDSTATPFAVGLQYTMSCYFKKTNSNRNIYMSLPATAFASDTIIVVDTATGALLDIDAGVDYAVSTYEGDGWFRFSLTATCTVTASGVVKLYLTEGENLLYSGDGASGVYYYGGQLTQSAKPLPYVKTSSVPAIKTFTESPRLEYDPITALPVGIAIWDSGTNLLTYSEQFSHANWVKDSVTVVKNNIAAPDGTTGVYKMISSAVSSEHFCKQNTNYISDNNRTLFVFVKKAELNWIKIGNANSSDQFAWFNVLTGEIGTIESSVDNADIQDVGDGWYKCTVTVTSSSIVVNTISVTDADNSSVYTGDGVGGIYIWGAQAHEGEIATPYIMTEGSAATRAADNLTLSSSGNFNANEYTLSIVTTYFNGAANSNAFVISDNTSANKIKIYSTDASVSGAIALTDSVTQFDNIGSSITIGDESSQIVTFKNNSASFYLNKVIDGTDTDCLPIADHNTIHIGSNYSGTLHLNGNIKSAVIYKEAMTAQEVELL